ncbi:MAG: cytochrome c [Chloroflexales bacterium]|nr:cytochrome c [Chloroflexales bacterium]
MNRLQHVGVFLTIVVLFLALNACGTAQPNQPTFGQLANTGQSVYATYCTECHGANGEGITGPAVIGAEANLVKFQDAHKLLAYVSAAMPQNNPGSLSDEEYRQLVSYLLIANQRATGDQPFNPDELALITLLP